MAVDTQVAESYARAAFEVATSGASIGKWSEMLAFAAQVSRDPDMAALLANAAIGQERQTQAFLKVCEGYLSPEGINLVRIMGENGRLAAMADVARHFEVLRREAEGRVEARVVSARPLSDADQKKISDALTKRLGKTVTLVNDVDESLIGGAIIHAGDLVIDGSIRGSLAQLAGAVGR
ncbi:MAG: F0F1 ATP synthase subunit delta [Halothiobacillaceae bacterium]|mgnify:CR=1 FL=1|nr:F0F1 ATP synthase subunit delta [Halothiobacillaceae bacterium]MDY0049479.1 F0F1 ATP synthase subunit delta [Halothiobacillaceae bacterium]